MTVPIDRGCRILLSYRLTVADVLIVNSQASPVQAVKQKERPQRRAGP